MTRLLSFFIPFILTLALCASAFAEVLPNTIVLSQQVLAQTKQKVLERDRDLLPAYDKLIKDADAALKATVETPTAKTKAPKGGTTHDYWSLAPYWWPAPNKPDGLPYVRKDGERNPEADSDQYDHQRLGRMSCQVQILALAYYLTDNELYAAKATALVQAWFCDAATRMTPNMRFAQSRPGTSQGTHTGIIETVDLIRVVDAARLLEPSRAWPKATTNKLKQWFSDYLDWLLRSAPGREEAGMENNHGTWFDVQVAVFSCYVDDTFTARTIVEGAGRRRITRQITPEGTMPRELTRTRSRHYTFFNLQALYVLACVGDTVGADVWHWRDNHGASLMAALDFAGPSLSPTSPWPHGQTGAFNPLPYVPLFRRAALVYKDDRYLDFLKPLPADWLRRDRSTLFY